MNIRPIQAPKRISYLDVLRGMAILFIYLANVYVFSGWIFIPDDIKTQFTGSQLNTIIKQLTVIFIDGKWYSIFSILFGIGFVIQYENSISKNISFVPFFVKRMLGLLFFGLIHLFFLWEGDILVLYALLGLILILFRNVTNKQLLIWASILLLLPVAHLLLMINTDNFYPISLAERAISFLSNNNIPFEMKGDQPDLYAFAKTRLDGTSWKQFSIIAFGMPLFRYMKMLIEGRIFKVLACFLIGIWAGRMILNSELLKNKALLKKIICYGFLIGIPMNVLMAFSKTQPDGIWTIVNYVSSAFGVVPLACAYAATVALLLNWGGKYFSLFASVGQMAMTNYIFQSIISILIYYGVGLGFALDTSLWQIVIITLIIFMIQVVLSTTWLRYFKYGPLEWIWRMMTYQKYIKIKK